MLALTVFRERPCFKGMATAVQRLNGAANVRTTSRERSVNIKA